MTELSSPEPCITRHRGQGYAPSWADRLTDGVARLPGPSWVYYLALGVALYAIETATFWLEGAYPVGTWLPARASHAFLAAMVPILLSLFHYLDRRAQSALSILRPVLDVSTREYQYLRYRLTTLPAFPTLLASLSGAAFVVAANQLLGAPAGYRELAGAPVSASLIYALYVITWLTTGAFLYHTVRQLRTIHHIHNDCTRVDLFRMQPLYAFSPVTALTAVSLTGVTYLWYVLNPEMLTDPTALAFSLPLTGLALSAFIWPLMGIHRLLGAEKEQLLDTASLRFQSTLVELHQRIDDGELERIDELHKAMASLEIEQRALERIPTWPWRPETVRLLIAALILPLGLWIAQVILGRWLGL